MITEKKREWAILQLQQKAAEINGLPKKSDFPDSDMRRIKAFLGPWPRALECAGLKEPKKIKTLTKEKKQIV